MAIAAVVIGAGGALVVGAAALWGLTPKQRRRASAIGVPQWMPIVLGVVAAGYAAGAVLGSFIPMLGGLVVVFVAESVARRRRRTREVPPWFREMDQLNSRPLDQLRHPVAHSRRLWRALGRPIRNKRETDAWFEERGL